MKKEKAAPQNGTTPTKQGYLTTKTTKIPTMLELAAVHLLECGMKGTSQLTAFARHRDFNYRNSIDDLRNDHGVIIPDELFTHQHSGGGVTRLKRYWLADRDQARKAAELVNHKRRQRGGAPLSQGQVASYLTRFPSTSQPQRG